MADTGRFSRKQRDEEGTPAPLPLPAVPVSNGEFVPLASTAREEPEWLLSH
jgi:hypothetical protein